MYLFFKRVFDLFVALLALILLSPLLLPLLVLLRCTGEGEVFYGQTRIGFQNRPFKIWKFATMLKNSPNMTTGSLTVRNDPRVTPLGYFLRKSKLNELPQLFNVILGDMSLVGPRPQMAVDFSAYSIDIQQIIYQVKPGITGIGSLIFRDEERLLSVPGRDVRDFYERDIAPYKGMVECWYQQKMSFSTDFWLLVLTIWLVIFPKSRLHFRVFSDLPSLPEALQ